MEKRLLAIKLDQMQTPLASFDRCNFLGCSSTREKSELNFYPFPVDDDVACFKWMLYSQNGELIGLPPEILSKMPVCERHFSEDSFVDESHEALIPSAIPIPLETPDAAYEDLAEIRRNLASSSKGIKASSAGTYRFSTKSPQVRAKIAQIKKMLKENESLKSQMKNFCDFKFEFNSRKDSANVLRDMQHRSKTNKTFSKQEQLLALKYYLASPQVYIMLLTDDFILPSLGMIYKWLTMIQLPAGINPNTMILLKQKVATMPVKDRQCVLHFNEMTIVPELFADSECDYIEGFEDLGELGRTDEYGDHALTLMVQSLYGDWKVPLSYYISHNLMLSKNLQKIITKHIELLHEIDLDVKAICCDHDNSKKKFYEMLNITKGVPFFEIADKTIMGLYDPSYLIRLIRKALQEEDLVVTQHGKRVSWNDVIATFNLTRTSKIKYLVPAIAERQFRNLEVAYQEIFTQDFASAMRAAVRTKELQSETALHTAAFLSIITNIFVCLTTGELPEAEQTLREGIMFLDGIQVDKEKHSCFEALSQTMRAVLKMWYKNREEYPVLELGRLTLQELDDLFSMIHEDLEYDEATVRDFRVSFEQIKTNLFKRSLKRAECVEEDFLFGFNFAMRNCYYDCDV